MQAATNPLEIDLEQLSENTLETLQANIQTELEKRNTEKNLDDYKSAELINSKWVPWNKLSKHANTRAVTPWILEITGTHEKYGVDGEWLDKQKIDGNVHMSITELDEEDIIKVSGASHNKRKHAYYRIEAITNSRIYYDEITEAECIENVSE